VRSELQTPPELVQVRQVTKYRTASDTVRHSTIQCSTLQYSTLLYSTVQCSTAQQGVVHVVCVDKDIVCFKTSGVVIQLYLCAPLRCYHCRSCLVLQRLLVCLVLTAGCSPTAAHGLQCGQQSPRYQAMSLVCVRLHAAWSLYVLVRNWFSCLTCSLDTARTTRLRVLRRRDGSCC
jgi:hypothetical protein